MATRMSENFDIQEIMREASALKWESIPRHVQQQIENTIAPTSLTKPDLTVLYGIVQQLDPTRALEVGLATGSSAVALLLGSSKLTSLDVIDPYQSSGFHNKGLEAIQLINNQYQLDFQFLPEFSHTALPKLLFSGKTYDYVFIDASHKFDSTIIEVFYADQMLDVGGFIIMDDRPWPMVGGVIAFLEQNYKHYTINTDHYRITLLHKTDQDRRAWFDFWNFSVPRSPEHERKIEEYRSQRKAQQSGQTK
jgi:predicted O-methyltransferase YrrM